MRLQDQIFKIKTKQEFNDISIEIFNHQYANNSVYQKFCNYLKVDPNEVHSIHQIPFLPIEFFKSHPIKTGNFEAQQVFLSSGTTGQARSVHHVKDVDLYEKSYLKTFRHFYGTEDKYCILALLPSYLEREGSSLIYMVDDLIKRSKHSKSGFFLKNQTELIEIMQNMIKNDQKVILIGVSFALLDLAEIHQVDLNKIIIMETGGMKGRREELTRSELHNILKTSFNSSQIHSEYGMTELLSQAYSKGNGIFDTPPWMRVLIRDINDPFHIVNQHKTGGINVIDLANINSCSFIATQDLGKKISETAFEVLGRFDNSDLRGCNLLIS